MRTVAAGSTTCTETTPGNCKVVNYPRTMAATGRVCGNTVSIDVLINGGFGVGLPIRNQLYNVTAFSFGRNDANDLYAGRQPPCDLALGDLHAEPLCGLLQLGAVGEQAGSWLPTFSSCALPCSGKGLLSGFASARKCSTSASSCSVVISSPPTVAAVLSAPPLQPASSATQTAPAASAFIAAAGGCARASGRRRLP